MASPPDTPKRTTSAWKVLLLLCLLLGGGALLLRALRPFSDSIQAPPDIPASGSGQLLETETAKKQPSEQMVTESPVRPRGEESGVTAPSKVMHKFTDIEKWGCKGVETNMQSFFSTLDRQPYFQEYTVGVPAQQYFLELIERVLRVPPVIADEGTDIYLVLKNRAHLFRTMGLMNISLVKDILQHEQDSLEEIAAMFYRWSELGSCGKENGPVAPSLEQSYEYAVFFLNTLGGQSYLARRDSRLRLLLTLYAIRLVDRANSSGNNRYGLDIRPFIERLLEEVQATGNLEGKEHYLDVVYKLQEKYQ